MILGDDDGDNNFYDKKNHHYHYHHHRQLPLGSEEDIVGFKQGNFNNTIARYIPLELM